MLFEQYLSQIKNYQSDNSSKEGKLSSNLLIDKDDKFSVYYAPFDYINREAKIVLCGITPGYQQADLALTEAKRQIMAGNPLEIANRKAKETASFGGKMRGSLISLLDSIGVNQLLALDSCERLFTTHTHYVHYTSVLRYPVFDAGKNYTGSSAILRRPILRQQLDNYFVEELKQLPEDCLYIPLGSNVSLVFASLIQQGKLKTERVLKGLPHPSGANAERISYFLGRKAKEDLSSKTNAAQIDSVRLQLMNQMAQLTNNV